MGEASMRKWLKRADEAYARDPATPMLHPHQDNPRRARALFLRFRERRLKKFVRGGYRGSLG